MKSKDTPKTRTPRGQAAAPTEERWIRRTDSIDLPLACKPRSLERPHVLRRFDRQDGREVLVEVLRPSLDLRITLAEGARRFAFVIIERGELDRLIETLTAARDAHPTPSSESTSGTRAEGRP